MRFTRDYKEFTWFTPPRYAPGLDSVLNMLPAGLLASNGLGAVPGLNQNISFSGAETPITESATWTNVSPRAVLDYKLAPDIMIYGSVAEGYQAGGFSALNVPSSSSNSETKPETMWSYEDRLQELFPAAAPDRQHLAAVLATTSSPTCRRWRFTVRPFRLIT